MNTASEITIVRCAARERFTSISNSVLQNEGLSCEALAIFDRALIPVSEAPFHVGLSARLKDYPIWGADYYIVRDDLVIQ